jgi:hypothetical protein
MKSKPKKQRQKKASEVIHMESWGCVNALLFHKGGSARIQINGLEVKRLLEALQRYILRKQKLPDPKLLQAVDHLYDFFAKGSELTVTADAAIAGYGVELTPIDMPLEEMDHGW